MKSSCFQTHCTIQHSAPWWSDWMWTIEAGQGQSWGLAISAEPVDNAALNRMLTLKAAWPCYTSSANQVEWQSTWKPAWKGCNVVIGNGSSTNRWERLLTNTGTVGDETPQGLAPGIILTTVTLTLRGSRRRWRLEERISHQAEVTVIFFNAACEPESNFGQLKGGHSP